MKKKIIDIILVIVLLFLMAYQVTGEMLHEWIGIAMTVLVIVHQILNRKWYGALFKGKYNIFRTVTTVANILLLASFALTAFCGMSMSGYAVPFLYGMSGIAFARRFHLAMSFWTFILMGFHLGLHIPAMLPKMKPSKIIRTILPVFFTCIAGYGLFLFLRSDIPGYILFRNPFAFLDYEKAKWLVILENLLMLVFWAFLGAQTAELCLSKAKKSNPLLPVVLIMAAVIAGLVFGQIIHDPEEDQFGGNWGANAPVPVSVPTDSPTDVPVVIASEEAPAGPESEPDSAGTAAIPEVDDGFVRIEAGSFLMGSPETENWRIEDEVQHEVSVSAFFIDPYETAQEDYERLTGENPSLYSGARLPVEQVTWTDALRYANAKSESAGLTPAYNIDGNTVTWDRSADGYRLPTEAEWEYACRAGTATPFNTERSLSAAEANFYGHYPYGIEENYFNKSVLEAQPGQYRGKTLETGSFSPNAWGLYDCHGNVNEWTWDFYGSYDVSVKADPTGPESGTRHVYRGGG